MTLFAQIQLNIGELLQDFEYIEVFFEDFRHLYTDEFSKQKRIFKKQTFAIGYASVVSFMKIGDGT